MAYSGAGGKGRKKEEENGGEDYAVITPIYIYILYLLGVGWGKGADQRFGDITGGGNGITRVSDVWLRHIRGFRD